MEVWIIYILCCLASWFILVDAWRDDFDLDWVAAFIFAFASIMGPFSLLIASCIWCFQKSYKHLPNIEDLVLWRKK